VLLYSRVTNGDGRLVKHLDALVFDLDGVLILGSNEEYINCVYYALRVSGIVCDYDVVKEQIQKHWGVPHRYQLSYFLGRNGAALEKACAAYEQYLLSDKFLCKLRVLPGAVHLLETLRSNEYIVAVLSGMHPGLIQKIFESHLPVGDLFKMVVSGYHNDLHLQKPNPQVLLQMIKDMGSDTSKTAYVGDSRRDMVMANKTNVTSVAVLTGLLSREEAEDLKVDYIVADATDILRYLE